MQIEGYVRALQDDLAAVAALGDEPTARAAQLLGVALESALARRLLEALTEAALELEGQLDGARVEVRLAGSGDPQLVVVREEPAPPLESVRAEAARSGATPTGWLLDLVERSVRPIRPKAA